MPVQKLRTISTRSRFHDRFQGVTLPLSLFWQHVQQWEYPAQLRDSFLEWIRAILLWIHTPDRAKRASPPTGASPFPLHKLAPLSFTKIKRFPRPPGPVRWAAASILLIFIPIVLINLLFPSQPAAWFNASWDYRKEITVDNTKVSGSSNLTDYPLLVSVTDSDLITGAQADADDILFTSADGSTQLDHEIESYDSGAGTLTAWVRIPTLSYNVDTTIYMYYGNGAASNQENATGVWAANHVAVYHMAEDPSASAPQLQDSTSNNLDATAYGSMTSGDLFAAKVNGGTDFDGSNDYFATSANLGVTSASARSVSLWFYQDASANKNLVGWGGSSTGTLFDFMLMSGQVEAHFYGTGYDLTSGYTGSPANYSTGTWNHAVITYDGTTVRIYVNGAFYKSKNFTLNTSNSTLKIASGGFSSYQYFNGDLDEVRVHNTALSADWITTTYNNQSSPSTFYTIGSQEAKPADWYNSSWDYRVKITVNSAEVDADLTDYPVYVSLANLPAGFHSNVKTDGSDIRVTSSDGLTEIPREVVFYDSATDTGELHFKGDVSSTVDTDFYIYYGNAAATEPAIDSTYGAENAWTKYEAVYHFHNSLLDSTTNDHDLTNVNSIDTSSGQIGNGRNFTSDAVYATFDLSSTAKVSVSRWFNQTNLTGAQAHYELTTNFTGYTDGFLTYTDGTVYYIGQQGNGGYNIAQATMPASGSYKYLVDVRDKSAAASTEVIPYIDGSVISYSKATYNSENSNNFANSTLYINARAGSSIYANGNLDEFRLVKDVLPATWISTEYNNQSSPSTFYTVGTEETEGVGGNPGDWYNASWQYRKSIAVTNNVSSENNVYISFDAGDVLDTSAAGKFQGDCGDIRFTTETGTVLPYAINSGCGTSSTDIDVFFSSFPAGAQTIYMYYGNSAATDGFSSPTLGTETTSYLTTGTTWSVPSDWNSSINSVEAIGAGGNGAVSVASTRSGAGGGGGEYRKATNIALTPSSTINISIPAGGAGSGAAGTRMQNNSSTTVLEAMNGGNASGVTAGGSGTGGTGAAGNYDGGAGGAGATLSTTASGGGGGGSAGPSGIGKNGAAGAVGLSVGGGGGGGSNGGSSTAGSANSSTTGGAGGAGNGGTGGGSGGTNNGNNAGAGTNGGGGGGGGNATGATGAGGANGGVQSLWDTGVGPSGGGGGGGSAGGTGGTGIRSGGAGGTYGGGGGGCGFSGTLQTGECDSAPTGGQGLLVITYTPIIPPFSTEATDYTIGTVGTEETPPSPEPDYFANELGGTGTNPNTTLVAYWPLDEQQGQTVNNRVAGAGNGTFGANSSVASDDPLWKTPSDCKINACSAFDGTNDIITVSDSPALSITGDMTISAWVKITDFGTHRGLIGKTSSNVPAPYDYFLLATSGLPHFARGNGTSHSAVTATTAPTPGVWQHVAVTMSGTTVTHYLNGHPNGTGTLTTSIADGDGSLIIGSRADSATIVKGSLDEVKIHNSALTQDQILVEMNAGSAVNFGAGTQEAAQLSDGAGNPPIAHWKFDENTGTSTTADSSGNNYTGTMNGSMTTADWIPGKHGSALDFDATDDTISNTSFSLGTTDFTIESWVKSNAAVTLGIVNYEGTARFRFDLAGTNSRLRYGIYSSSVWAEQTDSDTYDVSDGTWHHVAVTFDRDGLARSYVDGKLQYATLNISSKSAVSFSGGTLRIGYDSYSAGSYFNGALDDIKIYDYLRTPAQIAYDYNRGAPIGWWRMDECSGTTTYDASGNGNNGTVTIGATGGYTSVGTCSSGTSTEAWNAGTDGRFNSALGLDGTNDYVSVSQNASINAPGSQATFAGWYSFSSLSGPQALIDKRNAANSQISYLLQLSPPGRTTGTLRLTAGTSISGSPYYEGNQINILSNTVLATDTWYHIAAIYDGANSKIYINGVDDTGAIAGTYGSLPVLSDNDLRFGKHGTQSSNYVSGLIDDVRIYNYALSHAQIRQLMTGSSATFGPAFGSP